LRNAIHRASFTDAFKFHPLQKSAPNARNAKSLTLKNRRRIRQNLNISA
jgi:hypothetical protein